MKKFEPEECPVTTLIGILVGSVVVGVIAHFIIVILI